MHFIFTFLTKIYIFSASDLERASHWNSKSLILPDKLACPRKQWAESGTAASEILQIVPFSGP